MTRELRGDNVPAEPVDPDPVNDSDWVSIYAVEIPVMAYRQMRVRMSGFSFHIPGELDVDVTGETFVRVWIDGK